MKRFLPAIILAVLAAFVLVFTSVGAATYKLGDVDGSGAVMANDARSILRYSAKLESGWTDLQLALADVNGKDGINAADARYALRISAKLEEELTVTIEEPTSETESESISEEPSVPVDNTVAYENLPVPIRALLEGKFGMEGHVDLDGIETDANMYTDGTNLKMTVDGKEIGFDGMLTMMILTEEHKLFDKTISKSKKLYMMNDTAKTYLELNEATLKAVGLDLDTMSEMSNFDMAGLSNGKGASAKLTKETRDDVEYDVYSFYAEDGNSVTRMYMNGDSFKILEMGDTDGNINSVYYLNKFVAYPDATYFAKPDASGYKKQNIFQFFDAFEME